MRLKMCEWHGEQLTLPECQLTSDGSLVVSKQATVFLSDNGVGLLISFLGVEGRKWRDGAGALCRATCLMEHPITATLRDDENREYEANEEMLSRLERSFKQC